MDEGSGSDPHDLPCLIRHTGDHGLALHEIRSSEPVSDDAAGLSDGLSGRHLPVPSGSEHRYLFTRSLCRQTDRPVPLIRAADAGVLESHEATRTGFPLGPAGVGSPRVALIGEW